MRALLCRIAPLAWAATLAAAVLLLAGCHALPPVATTPWTERRAALQAVDSFALNGQLAAATANEGFSASVTWQQRGAASEVLLRAPLGVGGARLTYDGSRLQVTASDGSQLEGEAADAELVRLLGFEPPLANLRYWLLGVPAPAEPAAVETLDDSQRLARLQQADWQVDYRDYQPSGKLWLPRRVSIQRGALRLKLRVSNWLLP